MIEPITLDFLSGLKIVVEFSIDEADPGTGYAGGAEIDWDIFDKNGNVVEIEYEFWAACDKVVRADPEIVCAVDKLTRLAAVSPRKRREFAEAG